ncbi:MAG TPA: ribosomal-protein-alanine N-acetyltransferase [Chromatiaceae bacterium]|nr:ribosomal-protein-alanine N-acetyltransferase [Chromatiaceae bacterium]
MSASINAPLFQPRPMDSADLPEVMAIERRAYTHPWSEGIFRDCLRVGYLCRVCELEGRLIGHAVLSVAAGEAHLLNLCIDPDFQCRGLGRRLLEACFDEARQRRAETLFLEVRVSNKAAIRLYLAMGFNEVGIRAGYYPADGGRREDAFVFAKTLLD